MGYQIDSFEKKVDNVTLLNPKMDSLIEILTNVINDALKNKIDIGSKVVLNNYQTKLHREAAPIYLATNSIVNLYTSNILLAKLTRQFALRFVNTVKPIKQTFLNILK